MDRKRLLSIAKLLFSLGVAAFLYWRVIERQGVAMLWRQVAQLSFAWLALGFAAQVIAVVCSVWRWERLLVGQGIHAPWRHLIGSFLIARFFAEFSPGGWTGLNGYRLFDIAKQTGKVARSTACIGIEMVLGWLSFGVIAIAGSPFGVRIIGGRGVAIVDAFFGAVIALSIALVSKPALFRRASAAVGGRLRSVLDAVGAYAGKGRLVVEAALLGLGIHFFRAFIYIAAARALHAELSVGEVFFGSTLQVFATLLPASVNGVGLREATAVALYTRAGVPSSVALLIPTVGFLTELMFSSVGGFVFLARRVDYRVAIAVDDPEREDLVRKGPSLPNPHQARVDRA